MEETDKLELEVKGGLRQIADLKSELLKDVNNQTVKQALEAQVEALKGILFS